MSCSYGGCKSCFLSPIWFKSFALSLYLKRCLPLLLWGWLQTYLSVFGGNTLSSSRLLGLWRFMLPSFHSYAQEICAGAENCHALTIGASILGQVIGKSCSCCWRSFSISEALKQREPFSMTIPGRADIIPKLNGFFTTYFPSEAIRAISQKADFLCKARIVSVWSPVSCTGCSRKLENYVTSLRCNRCVSPNVTGPMQSWSLMMEKTLQRLWFLIPRCLTHQNESSDTSSGGGLVSTINKPFIYRFQILITTLYNTPIFNQKQIKGVGGPKLPRCLKELAGNQYVFPQTCTFNFTFNHRTFTGSSITEDILLDPLTVGRRPHRTSTESASETGGPSGKAKEVDDPNLPSLAEIEKSRKHPA
uniref:Replication factor A C-terminal domain-containing protein n=1 Tax=Brassica oleracea var. oleracea TaxID=109376 RepID=A0A0D3CH11_BRAOL